MALTVHGIVDRFKKNALNNDAPVRLTMLASLPVAQVEPPFAETTRAGLRYIGGCGIIANGIAPVQAIPTTTATLALFNGENQGGKCYVLDYIHIFLGSGTPAVGLTLMATVSTSPLTKPTAATGYSSSGAAGQARQTKAIWATAQTLGTTGIAPAWIGVGSNLQPATANAGIGDQPFPLDGRLIVPPGYVLGLAVLSAAGTTPLYAISAQWAELDLDLE